MGSSFKDGRNEKEMRTEVDKKLKGNGGFVILGIEDRGQEKEGKKKQCNSRNRGKYFKRR